MLTITTSPHFKEEKEYLFSTIFNDFLGLTYVVNYQKDTHNYEITYQNKKTVFEDHFFNNCSSQKNYLTSKNIPKNIAILNYESFPNLPVLYGSSTIKKENNTAIFELDIFASIFFMLTRWEEFVNPIRDEHQRFPASASTAFKNNFLHRPIVNEYIELIWAELLKMNYPAELRKKNTFELHISHDVDHPLLYTSRSNKLRKLGFYALKKKDVFTSKRIIKNLFSSNDPYDTFDFLMNMSEELNTTSRFYFMAGGTSEKDIKYSLNSPFIQNLFRKIKERNHIIGFHPSYNSYNDNLLWKKEKEYLANVSKTDILEGRQHYLRLEIPKTLSIWDENNMQFDSTLGYADSMGFRCGVCYPFHPFDLVSKKKLKLLEIPLIIMEGTAIGYMQLTPNEFYNQATALRNEVKKYHGIFSFLWHNSSFFTSNYAPFEEHYKNLING